MQSLIPDQAGQHTAPFQRGLRESQGYKSVGLEIAREEQSSRRYEDATQYYGDDAIIYERPHLASAAATSGMLGDFSTSRPSPVPVRRHRVTRSPSPPPRRYERDRKMNVPDIPQTDEPRFKTQTITPSTSFSSPYDAYRYTTPAPPIKNFPIPVRRSETLPNLSDSLSSRTEKRKISKLRESEFSKSSPPFSPSSPPFSPPRASDHLLRSGSPNILVSSQSPERRRPSQRSSRYSATPWSPPKSNPSPGVFDKPSAQSTALAQTNAQVSPAFLQSDQSALLQAPNPSLRRPAVHGWDIRSTHTTPRYTLAPQPLPMKTKPSYGSRNHVHPLTPNHAIRTSLGYGIANIGAGSAPREIAPSLTKAENRYMNQTISADYTGGDDIVMKIKLCALDTGLQRRHHSHGLGSHASFESSSTFGSSAIPRFTPSPIERISHQTYQDLRIRNVRPGYGNR